MRGAGRGVDGGDLAATLRGFVEPATGSNKGSGELLQGRETCSFPGAFTVGSGTTTKVHERKRSSKSQSNILMVQSAVSGLLQ